MYVDINRSKKSRLSTYTEENTHDIKIDQVQKESSQPLGHTPLVRRLDRYQARLIAISLKPPTTKHTDHANRLPTPTTGVLTAVKGGGIRRWVA